MDNAAFDQATVLLKSAGDVLVLTGAGLSAESGIPTFRGADGLWRRFRPEELASPEGFHRMPEQVWAWYRWRLEQVRAAAPNVGHLALARMARRRHLLVVNQNVDGLLEKAWSEAGLAPDQLLAIHGSIRQAHCMRCARTMAMEHVPSDPVPHCGCGGALRPSIVWFGEELDTGHLDTMDQAAREADLILVVGTSALVWPAAGIIPLARDHGASVLVVNPDARAAAASDCLLQGPASTWLPRLAEALDQEEQG